jgi:hypothetical protein
MEETKKPIKTTSSRRIEANRRNAQHSTGPKTDEGKATSSQNAIRHGIFVTKLLNGAATETASEIQELAAGLREHYKPDGIMEEILVQKIVVETARYSRVLGFEQPESGYNRMYFLVCLDKIMRYTTSTSRSLYRAIEELERLQAARKARESSAPSKSAVSAALPSQADAERPEAQVLNNLESNCSTPENTENGIAKVEAA